ncbi:MAG: DoxX-like family protein, partial [Pseudomonadota bacterium]
WRLWARRAALGMVALSGAYLLGSLIFAPDLWADPLGPMVKVIPALVLAALVWLLLEER